MTQLTRCEIDCLNVIKRLTSPDGVSPTYDQIQAELGLSSKSGVARLLDQLETKGRIKRVKFVRNSIEIINPLSVELKRLYDQYGYEAVKGAVIG